MIRELGELLEVEDQLSIDDPQICTESGYGRLLLTSSSSTSNRGELFHYKQWLELVVADGHVSAAKNAPQRS
jgi:hypothetical protein